MDYITDKHLKEMIFNYLRHPSGENQHKLFDALSKAGISVSSITQFCDMLIFAEDCGFQEGLKTARRNN